MASRMANLIQVHRDRDGQRVTIDGEEFPYFTKRGEGYEVRVMHGDLPAVQVTIVADRVEVVDDVSALATDSNGPAEVRDGHGNLVKTIEVV